MNRDKYKGMYWINNPDSRHRITSSTTVEDAFGHSWRFAVINGKPEWIPEFNDMGEMKIPTEKCSPVPVNVNEHDRLTPGIENEHERLSSGIEKFYAESPGITRTREAVDEAN